MKEYIRFRTLGFFLWMMAGAMFSSCSDDKNDPEVEDEGKSYYALLTGDMTSSPYAGYITTYSEVPSGTIDNVQAGSLAMQTNGMRYYSPWAFKRTSWASQGKDEIIRYAVNASGNMEESGRITSGENSNYYIHDESNGFYIDLDRGLLKIQKFNPSTMLRTGEIDLSGLRNEKYPYQDVGTNILASKDGKLYADVFYNTTDIKGNFFQNTPLGFVELAVIDVATGKYEKSIRNENINHIGYPSNENPMWSLGDDGALYFCSHGFGATGAGGSAIVRIKKGETGFDKNWIIKADDLTQGTSFGTVCVDNGKLYTQIGSKPLSYRGLLTDAIYDYYVFDKENPSAGATKIAGVPQTTYTFQCGQSIMAIDGKVYFRVVNNDDQNGYYVLGDNNTATRAFNVASGGIVWGFAKLIKKQE